MASQSYPASSGLRQLEDLKLAAENFRRAMIQSGATSHVKQSLYMEQLRALECALNPLNYRDDAQCSPDPWRTDMENRPKDRPYLVEEDDGSRVRYHVAEWKGDKENGILVIGGAFSFDRAKLTRWRDFELPAPSVPSTHCSSPAATIGDIPSEPRPPASAAMGLSAGDDADTLRSALKPFAAVAESDIGQDETDADIFQPMRSGYNREPLITVGDMRRAALVLSSTDLQTQEDK